MTVEIFETHNRKAVVDRVTYPNRYYIVTLTRIGNLRTSIRAEETSSMAKAITMARKWVK